MSYNNKKGKTYRNGKTNKSRSDSDREVKNETRMGIIKGGSHKHIGDTKLESNDPGWYKDAHGVTEDAAKISAYLPSGKAWWPLFQNDDAKIGEPVGCMVKYIPCPAVSTTSDSPISIAAQVVLQQIKKVLNKPVLSYMAADPIMAYIAFLSIVVQANELRRDYAVMNAYSTENLSFPKGVMELLGYNENSVNALRDNMANYRQRYNLDLYQISSIFMPFENNILEKYKWLSSGLWRDHDNAKAQVYGYVSEGYYIFDETSSSEGSMAKFVRYDHTQRHSSQDVFLDKLANLEACIAALRSSDSWNQMVSDMQRAFPDAQTYTFPILEEDIMPSIVYNEDMLMQFENIHTTPGIDLSQEGNSLNITQDVTANAVISQPILVPSAIGMKGVPAALANLALDNSTNGWFYNFNSTNPSADLVIENTAATTMWSASGSSIGIADSQLTHAIYLGFVITMPYNNDFSSFEMATYHVYDGASQTPNWILRRMNHAPMIQYIIADGSSAVYMAQPTMETDNLVRIPEFTLKRLFDAETFALWNVPNNVINGKIG